MKKTKLTRTLMAAVSVVALSAVMYGCVHSGGSDTPPPVVEPEPTAYEAGKAAIAAATTVEDAQAAFDAVDQTMVTGAEVESLRMALASRVMELDPPQPTAVELPELPEGDFQGLTPGVYTIAAGAYGGTGDVWLACDEEGPDCVITVHADGTATASPDSGTVYAGLVDTAQAALNAQNAAAERAEAQRMALATAAAAIDTSDLETAEDIAAATEAINALKAAIAAAVDVDDTSMYQSQVDAAEMDVRMAQTGLACPIAACLKRIFIRRQPIDCCRLPNDTVLGWVRRKSAASNPQDTGEVRRLIAAVTSSGAPMEGCSVVQCKQLRID